MIETETNLDYLIDTLRFQLGDITPATYRYLDAWLRTALVTAVKGLQRWWGAKYLIDDTTYYVYRNTEKTFDFDEPPVIQDSDERPLILMASILVKSGQLEANSWNVGSWRDAEVSVSNIEGGRLKSTSLGMDWEELKAYIMPPTRRLSGALRVAHPSTEE